ncbi:MAG: HEAT repeat domain-containing protein, partial [Anaerolineae bacterium]|nr:HEAT repeat domain-containing protein [Anaerolineae bacterium]
GLFTHYLPPKEERHKKLEGIVRKLLTTTRLLQEDNNEYGLPHYIWEEFFAAWYLAQQENGADVIQAHLNDPTWTILTEFFIGLSDQSTSLVDVLLGNAVLHNDDSYLQRASRWAIIAPEGQKWQSEVIKSLARHFMSDGTDPESRLLVGKYIGLTAGESARSFFIKMLSSSNLDIRTAALRGLGWSGSPREMPILAAALNDRNIEIQRSAIRGIGDLGTPGGTLVLKNYLFNASEDLAPLIAQSLAAMPDGPQVLEELSRHPDLLVRRAAVMGLGQISESWAIDILEEIIRTDPEWLVRSAAESVLESQQEESDKPRLILPQPKAEEVEWLMRWAARQGSGLGVGESAITMLVRAIQQGDANTKVLGVLTLNQLGRQEHLSVLQPLLHDSDELVKVMAQDVIQSITQRYLIFLGA